MLSREPARVLRRGRCSAHDRPAAATEALACGCCAGLVDRLEQLHQVALDRDAAIAVGIAEAQWRVGQDRQQVARLPKVTRATGAASAGTTRAPSRIANSSGGVPRNALSFDSSQASSGRPPAGGVLCGLLPGSWGAPTGPDDTLFSTAFTAGGPPSTVPNLPRRSAAASLARKAPGGVGLEAVGVNCAPPSRTAGAPTL